MDIAKLHAVLFDPKANVRITHDVHDGGLTISVDVASDTPPGYTILEQVTVPGDAGKEASVALRATTAMLFFPQEMERINEMLGAMKLTLSKDGKELTAEEAGRVLRNELHGKKD